MNLMVVAQNLKKYDLIFCCWCNLPSSIVWVHGHGQCSNCGINIDECCRGEIVREEDLKIEKQEIEKKCWK